MKNLISATMFAILLVSGSFSAFAQCEGDFDSTYSVGTTDLLTLLGDFGAECDEECATDMDVNGMVNTTDLLLFMPNFGNVCEVEPYGIEVALNFMNYSITQDEEGNDSQVTFEVELNITALGDDMEIAKNVNYSGFSNLVQLAMGDGFMVSTMTSSAELVGDAYLVEEDESETFTFTTVAIPYEAGYFQTGITKLMYRLPDGTELEYPEEFLEEFNYSMIVYLDPGEPDIIFGE